MDTWVILSLVVLLNQISVSTFIVFYSIMSMASTLFLHDFFILLEPVPADLCNPSPCGPNAMCENGVCTCKPEYHGDPYFECRPECTVSSECSRDKACVRNHCVDPCVNTCGVSANCEVINHMAVCTCPQKMTGNAFIQCSPIKGIIFK